MFGLAAAKRLADPKATLAVLVCFGSHATSTTIETTVRTDGLRGMVLGPRAACAAGQYHAKDVNVRLPPVAPPEMSAFGPRANGEFRPPKRSLGATALRLSNARPRGRSTTLSDDQPSPTPGRPYPRGCICSHRGPL